ncbi:Z1 domain-containing protein [Nesterenkonia sp. AN1]|uniref:Z1 domain-containing protein n=1 Tax=Nesterenkonia sp. AN1 TaxID=652017 RepID=UPI0004B68E93|nr:Z1 domain-containing protein [Nesterenkonia sp. AN1]
MARHATEVASAKRFKDQQGYSELTSLVHAWVDNKVDGGAPSEDELRVKVERLAAVVDDLANVPASELSGFLDAVTRELLTQVNTTQEIGEAVASPDYSPWIKERWAQDSSDWSFWNTYKRLLQVEDRPSKMIRTLEDDVKNILDLAGDPTVEGQWHRQGLVMGDVQSGKTSNFIGLMNMAADAGFGLFIVVGGHTEDLRSQTQERVDDGFIGRRSFDIDTRNQSHQQLRGVGKIRRRNQSVISGTTVESDFVAKSDRTQLGDLDSSVTAPVVLVVKKNSRILEKVAAWLKTAAGGGTLSTPLMFIDDESDYASVNTNKKDQEEATAVNRAIRSILDTSQRTSYIGFTATPFANVLINPDAEGDLFPHHFIYSLYAPSNYLGAQTYFGEDSSEKYARNDVKDAEKAFPFRHKSTHKVSELPGSLEQAIDAFIIACAVTDIETGARAPRSMLVNVSRFREVQSQVHKLVEDHLAAVVSVIRNMTPESIEGLEGPVLLQRLHKSWLREYSTTGCTWADIASVLPDAVEAIETELVNGDTAKQRAQSAEVRARSQNDLGRRSIAVGGTILSRGLTLDGLVISYFYQRTQLSDTLLQMGRWFGYRDAYKSLVRIWLPLEVMNWFLFTADALAEIRRDVSVMRQARMTPREFGLKIQKHPEALKVTAANKMRHADKAIVDLSFDRQSVETTTAAIDKASTRNNRSALYDLLSGCEGEVDDVSVSASRRFVGAASHVAYSNVGRLVVEDFIRSFVPGSGDANFARNSEGASFISEYVRSMDSDVGERWDVALMSGLGSPVEVHPEIMRISGTKRNKVSKVEGDHPYIEFSQRRVASGDNLYDIAQNLSNGSRFRWDERIAARSSTRSGYPKTHYNSSLKLGESDICAVIDRPILMIYIIESNPLATDQRSDRAYIDPEDFVLGLKLTFPALRKSDGSMREGRKKTQYIVNRVWMQESGLAREGQLQGVVGDDE